MAKDKFVLGLGLGILAGIAGKIIYDNRDDIAAMIQEKSAAAADDLSTFANYAGEKVEAYTKVVKNTAQDLSEKTMKKAKEVKHKAQKQYEDLKKVFQDASDEFTQDLSSMAAEEIEDEIIIDSSDEK